MSILNVIPGVAEIDLGNGEPKKKFSNKLDLITALIDLFEAKTITLEELHQMTNETFESKLVEYDWSLNFFKGIHKWESVMKKLKQIEVNHKWSSFWASDVNFVECNCGRSEKHFRFRTEFEYFDRGFNTKIVARKFLEVIKEKESSTIPKVTLKRLRTQIAKSGLPDK